MGKKVCRVHCSLGAVASIGGGAAVAPGGGRSGGGGRGSSEVGEGLPSGGFIHRRHWAHLCGSRRPKLLRPYLCAIASAFEPGRPVQLQAPPAPVDSIPPARLVPPNVAGGDCEGSGDENGWRSLPAHADVPFEALSAGMLLQCHVSGVLSNGLSLSFCGYLQVALSPSLACPSLYLAADLNAMPPQRAC